MTPRAGRVLLVVPSTTSYRAFLTEAAEAWLRRGGAMALAAGPDLPGHAADDGPATVERFDMPETRFGSPLGLARAVTMLRRHVRAWRPDIVHAHFAASAVVAAATRQTMGTSPMAWMATFHGMHLTANASIGARLVSAAEVWAAKRMSVVCVLNREDRDALVRLLPASRVHLHASVGVGCDLDAFDPVDYPPATRTAIRARLGLPADAFVVAYVGRQVAFKGFTAAVHGFLEAESHGLDGWLVLVGAEDSVHGSGLTDSERFRLGSHPRIVRVGWQRDVASYLAAADVTLLPSIREGMPVSAMESLAIGTPVITVDSRGCRDVVRDRVDGLVLPSPDPSLIAQALLACRGDGGLLEGLRRGATAGRSRFDRRRFAEEQADLYSSVLGTSLPTRTESVVESGRWSGSGHADG